MADLTRRMSDAQGAVMIISDVYIFALGYALGGWLTTSFALATAANFFIAIKAEPLDLTNFDRLLSVSAINDIKTQAPAIISQNSSTVDAAVQRAEVVGLIPERYATIRLLQSAQDKDADFSATTKTYRAGLKMYKICNIAMKNLNTSMCPY